MGNMDDDLYDSVKEGSKKAGKAAAKMGKNAVRKLTSKVGKKAVSATKKIGKLLIKAIIKTIIALLPWIVLILSLLSFIGFVAFAMFEIKGNIQAYNPRYENNLEVNDEGRHVSKGTTPSNPQNNTLSNFYKYVAGQSVHLIKEDEPKVVYTPDDDGAPKDYYNREKDFRLDPNMLYSMDKYAFGGDVLYPEQIIQPVQYDSEFRLVHLTNDKRELTAESKKLNEAGEIIDETHLAVSDYGLGSVLKYTSDFNKEEILNYKYKKKDVWDDTQKKVVPEEYKEENILNRFGDPWEYKQVPVPNTEKPIDLITNIVSIQGNIKYRYDPKEKENEKNKKPLRACSAEELNALEKDDVMHECNKVFYDEYKEKKTKKKEDGTLETYTVTHRLYKTREGYFAEHAPYPIEEEKNVEEDIRYVTDYFTFFASNRPEESRTLEELERNTPKDSYIFTEVDPDSIFTSDKVNNSPELKAAAEYFPIMVKYSKIYGVNPYIILAMAATESSGDHEGKMQLCRTGVKAACGLMQVESPGEPGKVAGFKVKNYETGQIDSWQFPNQGNVEGGPLKPDGTPYGLRGIDAVSDVDHNILAGVMEFATKLDKWGSNIYIAIQAYNYGDGDPDPNVTEKGMYAVLKRASDALGKPMEYWLENPDDLSWADYHIAGHGTEKHYEKVVDFYVGEDFGIPITAEFADRDSSSSSGGFISSATEFLKGFFKKFKKEPTEEYFEGKRIYYENGLKPNAIHEMITIGTIMTTKGNYQDQADAEEQKNMLYAGYMNNLSATGGTIGGSGGTGILAPTLPSNPTELDVIPPGAENFITPTDLDIIKAHGGMPSDTGVFWYHRGDYYHKGIDFSGPLGTACYAITDGVVEISNYSESAGNWVVIRNDESDMIFVYMHFENSTVVAGQKVSKGQVVGYIGTTGKSSGPHLHFELYHPASNFNGGSTDRIPINPTFLTKVPAA